MKTALELLNHVPAGMFVAILGGGAAVLSLFDNPPRRGWPRFAAIGVATALMVGETYILKHQQQTDAQERFKQQSNFATLLSNMETVQITLSQQVVAQDRVERIVNEEKTKAMQSSLRVQAAQLSADVLNFLAQRNSEQPQSWMFGLSGNETSVAKDTVEREARAQEKFDQQTEQLFVQRFWQRIVAVHEELLKTGIRDQQLENMMSKQPVTPLLMMNAAVRIGVIAEKMK